MRWLWESRETATPEDPRMPGDRPIDLVIAVLVVAGFISLAPASVRQELASSLRRELAFDDALQRDHQARLEQHRPGALARLRALAADLSTTK